MLLGNLLLLLLLLLLLGRILSNLIIIVLRCVIILVVAYLSKKHWCKLICLYWSWCLALFGRRLLGLSRHQSSLRLSWGDHPSLLVFFVCLMHRIISFMKICQSLDRILILTVSRIATFHLELPKIGAWLLKGVSYVALCWATYFYLFSLLLYLDRQGIIHVQESLSTITSLTWPPC